MVYIGTNYWNFLFLYIFPFPRESIVNFILNMSRKIILWISPIAYHLVEVKLAKERRKPLASSQKSIQNKNEKGINKFKIEGRT